VPCCQELDGRAADVDHQDLHKAIHCVRPLRWSSGIYAKDRPRQNRMVEQLKTKTNAALIQFAVLHLSSRGGPPATWQTCITA
jgi:hypothetical protein